MTLTAKKSMSIIGNIALSVKRKKVTEEKECK
jgi:hypothetical protein